MRINTAEQCKFNSVQQTMYTYKVTQSIKKIWFIGW